MTPEQERLVTDNLDLVARVVRRTTTHDTEEAYADGRLGLVRAALTWRPDKGTTFQTYAWMRIRGEIIDGWRARNHTRYKSAPLLAPVPLDVELRDPNPGPLEQVLDAESNHDLLAAVDALPHRERVIVTLLYWAQWQGAEVAEWMGVSGPRVSQLHRSALDHLARALSPASQSRTP